MSRLSRFLRNKFSTPTVVSLTPVASEIKINSGAASNARLQALFFNICERLQPSIFLDIGANDGAASIMARRYLPSADIHAFEANTQIQKNAKTTLAAHGIKSWNLAVSNESGSVTIFIPKVLSQAIVDGVVVPVQIQEGDDTGKSSMLRRNENAEYSEIAVPAVSLDDFAVDNLSPSSTRDTILWIDVEGAADRVVSGGLSVLDRTLAAIVEMEGFQFWKNQSDRLEVVSVLASKGFVALLRDEEYGDLQHNTLFVHKSILDRILPLSLIGSDNLGFRPFIQSPTPDRVPVIIPTFNTVTYVRAMVAQLRERGFKDIRLIDNNSTYAPMVDYLNAPDPGVTIIALGENKGPRHALLDPSIFNALPDVFCLSDPDLIFNPQMPTDFLSELLDISRGFSVGKVGLALDISNRDEMRQEDFLMDEKTYKIWEWENRFWQNQIWTTPGGDPVYSADIDTTFALYNKKYFKPDDFYRAIRVGGKFTCRHRPWYPNNGLPKDEEVFYRSIATHSYYFFDRDSSQSL